MNLIVQLGGYERAKDGLHRLKLEKKDLLTCGDLVVVESEIDAALIEYRRQHNIFEVGDAVIRKWNGRLYYLIVDIDNDGQEFLIHHDKGAKFKDCRIFDNICNFKHATDEESKAGKRLEVNQ